MNMSGMIRIGYAFLKAKLFNIRTPVLVGWSITNKCNSMCRYCGIVDYWPSELNSREVIALLHLLREAGTTRIHFSGGEPLLRDDFGEILSVCSGYNITTVVLTNGSLFTQRINWLKKVAFVRISFDGPEEVHDYIRNRKGSHKEVIEALECARKERIPVVLNVTIGRHNIDYFDYILSIASRYGARVKIYPINNLLIGQKNIDELVCSPQEYAVFSDKLLRLKKTSYKRCIVNSEAGIEYFKMYPNTKKLSCCGGILLIRVDPMGGIYRCAGDIRRFTTVRPVIPQTKEDLTSIINALPRTSCNECLCSSTLELNLKYSGMANPFSE